MSAQLIYSLIIALGAVFLASRYGGKLKTMFPKFWYESNACWGWVNSPEELCEMARLKLAEPSLVNSVDSFLDNSLQYKDQLNYGTRMEHQGETLRTFLEREGALALFLEAAKRQPELA